MKNLLVFSLLFSVFTVCSQTINYTESDEDILNPDRGFYTPYNGIASNFTPLNAGNLQFIRSGYIPFSATYSTKTSIVFRHYVLDSFVNSEISSDFLTKIQDDFDIARNEGVKMLLRFSYTITPNTGDCGSFICPPYGDAPKDIVLNHIAQLKPLFQNNEDIIVALQSGFIGVWGEQYYSDYFGDPSAQGKLLDNNWQDRIDVLEALLDALPESKMIQVRLPQMKQKFIYGINAGVNSAAMTSSQAHNKSDISRIGMHNDCFLASSNDQGTYLDYGTSNTASSDQTTALKSYSATDSQFTAVGGETCADAFNPQNNCDTEGGQTILDMDALNFSYLNAAYNTEVNNDWETGGCMEEIKKSLGYRLVLNSGTFPSNTNISSTINFSLNVTNKGFAAPFNLYNLNLVLRNTSNNTEYKIPFESSNSDVRFWLSNDTVTVNENLPLPENIEEGDYQLLIHLNDPSNENRIANNPNFSIQFANTGTWEATTGYNDLLHTVSITNTSLSTQEEIYLKKGIKVYPNPVVDNLFIHDADTSTPKNYEIYTLSGEQIFTFEDSTSDTIGITTTEYSAGVYLLKVQSDEAAIFKKFIIVKN